MFGTLALTVVGAVVGSLLARRYPIVGRQQIFAAVAAIVGSVLIMARPGGNDSAWYYISATIAVSMGTFLIMTWLQPRNTPPSAS
jgi:uncharacterized membrane protein YeiH